jgi:uncharacterized protein YkwD
MPLHRRCLTLVVLGLFCLPGVVAGPTAESAIAAAPSLIRASSLVDLANQQRSLAGLPPLRANSRLMLAAQTQAEQSASERKLAHVLPGQRYPRPEDRLDASGYPWRAFAENIAVGHRSATEAIDAWMKSPGHRRNMLSASYTEMGTGVATDAGGRAYFVQVFGRPI